MTPPLVSCIVPVFNGERYLREALESILAQTHRPIEIIVADDGSTDSTPDVARELGPMIRYIRQGNAGPAAARNLGLSVATGELVAFLDHDDLWHEDKLARQVVRFAERSELDLCVTLARNFWSPELLGEARRRGSDPRDQGVPGYVPSALVARRALFGRIGPFDPSLRSSDKTEWFLRANELGAVVEVLPEVLTYHRMHRESISYRRGAESRREYLRLLKHSLDRRRGRPTLPSPSSPPRGDDPCASCSS